MIRDVIDSLMAGTLLSQLPVWQLSGPMDKVTLVVSLAAIIFIILAGIKHEPAE